MPKLWQSAALGAGLLIALAGLSVSADADFGHGGSSMKHVLLISIDGMHAVDFINCSQGISGVNNGNPYCPNLAQLAETGVNYLETSTSKPSDSFPGLMALVTGGSPRTVGAFYDVAYDRVLAPPATTTGNGVAAGTCTPGVPNGSTTEFDEGIDIDKTLLNGGAPNGADGGIASIDPTKLDRDPFTGCAPVYPWNFVRTNTIFGVVHAAGGYTAWSDKHPSYSAVSGPGNGTNVDDYYAPEINSIPVNLPQVTILNCNRLPDQTAVTSSNSWTDSFANIQCYDSLKVQAILNEIDGKDHSGAFSRPIPSVFGMNFQVVSVGQKLIEKSLSPTMTGGYLDNEGTPTPALLSEIEFADISIGRMVAELKNHGLYNSTLIIISAKHGQSPVDSARYLGISTVPNDPITTSPATILQNLLPYSESPANPTGIGPTEDDISLLWLSDSSQTEQAVQTLEQTSPATNNIAGIGEIFSGPGIAQMFNPPGLPPNGDPRTPDIIVQPNIGVTYSGSTKKLAEHGGFSHDDTNVIMLVSNPSMSSSTVTSPVETYQVAPTILVALGLDPHKLTAVQLQRTQVLPGLGLVGGNSR